MKKLITLIILCFFTMTVSAQKVKTTVDEFTGEKIVTSDYLKIYQGGVTGANQTVLRFRHENGKNYIEYRIFTDAVVSCEEGEKILLKTDKGIVETTNSKYTLAEPGAWSHTAINNKLGIYLVCHFTPTELQDKTLEKIRFNFRTGYCDIDIKQKNSFKLQQLLSTFIEALSD